MVSELSANPGGGEFSGKKIAVFSQYFAPDSYGIAPYSSDLAKWLVGQGAEVVVVTMPPHYPQWQKPDGYPNKTTVEDFHGATLIRAATYVPQNPSMLKRLAYESSWSLAVLPKFFGKYLRKLDAVVAHPGIFATQLAVLAAKKNRSPLIVMVQDIVNKAATQSGMRGAAGFAGALGAWESWLFRSADQLTVPTDKFIPPVLASGVDPAKITVVPNWSRIELPEVELASIRQKFGWEDNFTLFHTGNIGLKQGLELLAPVLAELAETIPQLKMVFVGAGSQNQALQTAVGQLPNVQLLGSLSDTEFVQVIQAADAFLVHERPEVTDMSLPSKLTTYFAAARPVLAITSANSATAIEVNRSKAGAVHSPGDVAGITATLKAWLSDQNLRTELGDLGKMYSVANLSPAAALTKFCGAITAELKDK